MSNKFKNNIYIGIFVSIPIIVGIIFLIIYLTKKKCPKGQQLYKEYGVCGPICTDNKKPFPLIDKNGNNTSVKCCSNYLCNNTESPLYGTCITNQCSNLDLSITDKYIDNKDNCNCKRDCSSDYPNNIPENTDMTHNDNGKYVPKKPIICTSICDVAKTKYCSIDKGQSYYGDDAPTAPKSPLLCGKSQTSTTDIGYSGCFNPDEYKKCNKNSNICYNGSCGEDGYCKKCPDSYVYPCLTNYDCTNNHCYTGDTTLKKRHIYIGYCTGTNNTNVPNKTGLCVDKKQIGQKKNGQYEICKTHDYGINLKLNTCDNDVCATKLCDNGWQKDNGNCIYDVKPQNIICCDKKHLIIDPDQPSCSKSTVCKNGTSCIDNGNGKGNCVYCCSADDETYGCYVETKYPYSAKALGVNTKNVENDHIICSSDSDCNIFNKNLFKNLGKTDTPPQKKTDIDYSTLYCDKKDKKDKKGYCKAYCGFLKNSESIPGPYSSVNYNGDNDVNSSYCFRNDTDCKFTDSVNYQHGVINDIPICCSDQNGHCVDKKNLWWTKDNSGSQRTYTTSYTRDLTGDKCKGSIGSGVCINEAAHMSGVKSVDITDNQCTFNIECDTDDNFTSYKDSNNNFILWNDLGSKLQSNDVPKLDNWKSKISTKSPFTKPNCTGSTNFKNTNLTVSPEVMNQSTNDCDIKNIDDIENIKLLETGEYCYNHIDVGFQPSSSEIGTTCNYT